VYLYWCLIEQHLDAEELQLKSPHVRRFCIDLTNLRKMQNGGVEQRTEVEAVQLTWFSTQPQSCSLLNPEAERDGFQPNSRSFARPPLRAATIGVPIQIW